MLPFFKVSAYLISKFNVRTVFISIHLSVFKKKTEKCWKRKRKNLFFYQRIKSWRPLKISFLCFFFLIFLIISYRRIFISEWLSIFWNFTTTRSYSKWSIRWRKEWDHKRWMIQCHERATQFLDDLFRRDRCARSVYAVSARTTNNSGNHSNACSTTSKLFWLILDPRRDRKKTVDLDSSDRHDSTRLFFLSPKEIPTFSKDVTDVVLPVSYLYHLLQ